MPELDWAPFIPQLDLPESHLKDVVLIRVFWKVND